METSLVFHSHPTEITWEEYAFGRLSEKRLRPVEEHLLACELCQGALEELTGYIQLMKAGTAKASLMKAGTTPAEQDGLVPATRFIGPR